MKRSDMVKLIHDKLVGERLGDMVYAPNFAEHMLDFIEGIGMIPPPYTALPDVYNRYEFTYGFTIYEWEYEDDAGN